ncbi:MAG: glycosyltransferase [Alicyclobacillaceae bacterium]|nr:glycosyltransferase [Alicyclobacillaceae bacterium]
MRVLLLTEEYGSGHTQVALAIAGVWEQVDPGGTCLVAHVSQHVYPQLTKVLVKGYLNQLRWWPESYRAIYQWTYRIPLVLRSSHRLVGAMYRGALQRYVDQVKPDIILGTHPFCLGLVSALRQTGGWTGILGAVVTDFSPHPYWILPEVDRYFVPLEVTAKVLADRGVDRSRIAVTGMPVRPFFWKTEDRERLRARYGIGDEPLILVAAGALGLGPLDRIVESLDRSDVPWRLVVVTGHNAQMYQKLLQWRARARHPAMVLGFVHNMHEWMEMADVIVTKPGGVTVAEAIMKGLPAVLTAPLPGQEEDNAELLVRLGLARYSVPSAVGEVAADLVRREDLRLAMRERMRRMCPGDGARRIAEELVSERR